MATKKKLACYHPEFIHNKCTGCGKCRIKCTDITTIPFHYIKPTLCLNVQEIQRLRDQNFQSLVSSKKLHLILDLDNTLIHSMELRKLNKSKGKSDLHTILDDTAVKLRPGAQAFVEKVSSLFDLSIYTSGTRPYATSVAKLLNPKGMSLFGHDKIISREDYTTKLQKNLEVVLYPEQVVLIVDDLMDVWAKSARANVLTIEPYHHDFLNSKGKLIKEEEDEELARVRRVLTEVHSRFFEGGSSSSKRDYAKRDVRQLLQGVQMTNELDQVE